LRHREKAPRVAAGGVNDVQLAPPEGREKGAKRRGAMEVRKEKKEKGRTALEQREESLETLYCDYQIFLLERKEV